LISRSSSTPHLESQLRSLDNYPDTGGEEPKLIRHPLELAYMFPFETDVFPTTIHLHGYWQNHHVYQNSEDWETFGQAWVQPLAPSIARQGLVVLGYAGCPEDIVFRILNRIRENHMAMSGNIYWCCRNGALPAHDTYAALLRFPEVRLVEIEDADSFMLQIGAALGLEEIQHLTRVAKICPALPPGYLQTYANHAEVKIESSNEKYFGIEIKTSQDHPESGENYAVVDIYPVHKRFDISGFKDVTIKYEAAVSGSWPTDPTFEFKIHSKHASRIESVSVKATEARFSLKDFTQSGVVLQDIDKIGFASNGVRIGLGNTLSIKIHAILFSR
jgi:hypothetical protein